MTGLQICVKSRSLPFPVGFLLLQIRGLLARGLQLVFCPVKFVHKPLCAVAPFEGRYVLAITRFVRRSGEVVNGTITLEEDPRIEIVPVETSGGTLTDDQRKFRESWLTSQRR